MEKKSTNKIWITTRGLLLVLATAYLLQFLSTIGEKGQGPMGKAFEIIGYHALQQQYDGIPQMRVVRAFAESDQCSFWNFEWTWGRCVGVSLYVRDYRPEHKSIVDAQVQRLGERMRRPCELVRALALPNEVELGRDLGCGEGRRLFKLHILVTSITLANEHDESGNPRGWWATNHQKLYSYFFQGEI